MTRSSLKNPDDPQEYMWIFILQYFVDMTLLNRLIAKAFKFLWGILKKLHYAHATPTLCIIAKLYKTKMFLKEKEILVAFH